MLWANVLSNCRTISDVDDHVSVCKWPGRTYTMSCFGRTQHPALSLVNSFMTGGRITAGEKSGTVVTSTHSGN